MIDGRLVVGTRGSALLALDPKTGERLWDMGFWGSWVESSAVGGGDGLGYIGSSDLRRITSFDPKTGRIIWRTDVYGAPWGKPLVTDKFVYDGVSAIVPYMTRHVGRRRRPRSGFGQARVALSAAKSLRHTSLRLCRITDAKRRHLRDRRSRRSALRVSDQLNLGSSRRQ
jgi:hypothetical protein